MPIKSYLRKTFGESFRPPPLDIQRVKTPETIKLKLSDFEDTLSRHILQDIPFRYILKNKVTNSTLQHLFE